VTALALCARGPLLAAPAMHPRMWDHPATRRNVAELAAQGRVTLAGPVRGEVASGEEGVGRMAEPADIAAAAAALLAGAGAAEQDLAGVRVLVTAGPTLEDIDPVRFLGNRSSGKMGFAIAARAAVRGADVTLVTGPVELPTPPRVRRVDVRSALDMRAALWSVLLPDLSGADVLIMAAAVADHRPAEVATTKIKKNDASPAIALVKNPDLLAEIGAARASAGGAARAARPSPVLVGFAVETSGGEALAAYARRKLTDKQVDMVVCNEAKDSFGHDDSRIGFVARAAPAASAASAERDNGGGSGSGEGHGSADAVEFLPRASKAALADAILGRVRAYLQ
jgi:phosphopantothenoylcysteine decarboxylase/phosphopantothenate--cysteine ligase